MVRASLSCCSAPDRIDALARASLASRQSPPGVLVVGRAVATLGLGAFIVFVLAAAFLGPRRPALAALIAELAAACV